MAEFLTMDEAKSKLMLKDTLMLAAASLKLIC